MILKDPTAFIKNAFNGDSLKSQPANTLLMSKRTTIFQAVLNQSSIFTCFTVIFTT